MAKLKYDIECEEFYELMQIYRHEPLDHFDAICQNYWMVKDYISGFVEKQIEDQMENIRRAIELD